MANGYDHDLQSLFNAISSLCLAIVALVVLLGMLDDD
jgi:hypothetical protein